MSKSEHKRLYVQNPDLLTLRQEFDVWKNRNAFDGLSLALGGNPGVEALVGMISRRLERMEKLINERGEG